MKKLIAAVSVSAVALYAASAFAAGSTMVGYISDTKCATSGSSKAKASEWIVPAAFEKCVKECVQAGSEAVFVTEDNKILKFDAVSAKKVEAFHGHKVSVVGTVTGSTLSIDTITGLKLQ